MAQAAHDKGGTNPFWTFSLEIYSSKAVQDACVELQDVSGVDVNVMLYVLWLADRGRRLSVEDVRAVLGAVDGWRAQVVVPLRTARRALKTPPPAFDPAGAEALRTMVKKVELEAERLQQSALYGWRPVDEIGEQAAFRAEAAAANLEAYGKALGRELATGPVGVMLEAHASRAA
ncbi:MAG: TIGR02444 family protein [Alphaproteobacteria bacterium]